MKLFKNFWSMIKKACEKGGDVSSTRLTSFIFTAFISLFILYFIGMGIFIVITGGGVIPNEMLIVFGALLAHQLTLLGINKHNETKQKISENTNVKAEEIPVSIPVTPKMPDAPEDEDPETPETPPPGY